MTTASVEAEAQIRSLVEGWVEALSAKDLGARTSCYAPNVLLFDVINPLQHIGVDALRARLAQWFSTFQGPVYCEIRDLSVTAGDDVAFSHSLNRFSGTTNDGGRLDMWVRSTACLRKTDGRWTVVHEHASVPFDATTGRASLDLRP